MVGWFGRYFGSEATQELYWREQFKIMAAKRDVQRERGNVLRKAVTEVGEKRDIWKERALNNGYRSD